MKTKLFLSFMFCVFALTTANAQSGQTDNRTMKQINDEAKKNNQTTPQTYMEFMDAAADAKKTGNVKLAAEYYGEAMKMRSDEPTPYFERGVIYFGLKDNDKALKDFNQYIKMKPTDGLSFYNRGTTLFLGKNDYKKAIADFSETLKIMPDYVDAYINRGLCQAGLKKFEDSEKDLNKAAQMQPNNAGVYKARSIVYKLQGKATLAQADELRAQQLGGN